MDRIDAFHTSPASAELLRDAAAWRDDMQFGMVLGRITGPTASDTEPNVRKALAEPTSRGRTGPHPDPGVKQ
jgi:hypothetical protein